MFTNAEPPRQENLLDKVTSLLGIEPNERVAVGLLFGQSFFIGLAMITFYVAANALFLDAFPSTAVSYTYLGVAIATIILGYLFATLETRFNFGVAVSSLTLFLILSILAMRLALLVTDARWVFFMLMVWVRILYSMANLQLFAMAGRLFNVRQGKRLFPLIAAGAVLAIIAVGAFASPLINLLGTANLIWLTVLSLTGVLFFVQRTIHHFHTQINQTQANNDPQQRLQLNQLLRERFVQLILLFAFFTFLVSQVLDYIFLNQAALQFSDVDALSQFFAYYMGGATFFNLIFLALFAGRLLDRYGITFGLLSRAGLIGIGAVAVALSGALSFPFIIIFGFIVLMRLVDEVTAAGTMGPALRLLYQVLPSAQRVTAQTVVETFVGPLATGLTGIALITLTSLGAVALWQANLLLLFVVILAVITSLLLKQQYQTALQKALAKRFVGETSLQLDDPNTRTLLKQQLSSPHPTEIIFALNLLSQTDDDTLPQHLITLLSHPTPLVRQHTLTHIEERHLTEALPTLQQQLAIEQEPHLKANMLITSAALGEGSTLREVATHLTAPDLTIRQGALIGLLRHGTLPHIIDAGQQLLQLIHAPNVAERTAAATIIGQLGVASFAEQLMPLLHDDALPVQQAAIEAAQQLQHPSLWPELIALLTTPHLKETAQQALAQGGSPALAALDEALATPAHAPQHSHLYLNIIGRIGGQHQQQHAVTEQAIASLLAQLKSDSPQQRITILQGLHRCHYHATQPAAQQYIREQMARELQTAHTQLTRWGHVQSNSATALLQKAVATGLDETRTRLFYLLDYLHPHTNIRHVQQSLETGSSEQQAYAQEILDTILDKADKIELLPWLLPQTAAERWQQQTAVSTPSPLPQQLETLLTTTDPTVTIWIRSCALYAIGHEEVYGTQPPSTLTALQTAVSPLTQHNHPLLRETAVWAYARLTQTTGANDMLLTIEKVLILRTVTIFQTLPDNVLAELANTTEELLITNGQQLWARGDTGDTMYIIVSGKIHIHNEAQTISYLTDRAIFGELAVLSPAPRMASATAVEDTHLLSLNREHLYELIDDYRQVAHGIIEVLSQRLRTTPS